MTHQVQLIEPARVNDVLERDDVRVLQLAQQRDLPDRRAGNALVLCLETHFLERDDLAGAAVLGLVDDAVGALAELGKRRERQ